MSRFLRHARISEIVYLVIATLYLLHVTADAQIGVCYGTLGNNLPPPGEVIALCNQYNIRSIRIFNPNPSILQALQISPNISVTVGIANEDIIGIANDANAAISWVQNNILNYRNVNFRYIAVGNEIRPSDSASSSIAPAMQNIYNAISAAGLSQKIKVSAVLSMDILGQSYPPSTGAFKPEIRPSFIDPIVSFLSRTGGPFMINLYPYFAYISNTKDIHLDYALFTSPSPIVSDGQYQYQNLFDGMLDAVNAALDKAGGANINVVVSETGWPSGGGTATTIDNAKTYISNLIKNVRKGTPRRPGNPVEVYIFDLIDENQKTPEFEKHWGLFLPSKQPKYPLALSSI